MKHRFGAFVVLTVLMSSLIGGYLGGSAAAGDESTQTSPNEFLREFTEAVDLIQKNYVGDIGADKLVYSAIKGMLRALDPHSSFFTPKEYFRLREDQHSKYSGLGIRVRPLFPKQGRMVIVEPPAVGSPAERRGLRAGDVIMEIEGEPIDSWTSEEVISNLKGVKGTTVNITVERPGIGEPLHFAIQRDEIPLVTVPYAFEVRPDIGYIRIDRFSESTSKELEDKLESLRADKLSGLILDLRNNPGGLLSQAIQVSENFVPRNEKIVSTKGRVEGTARDYKARELEKLSVPIVVLINQHSASASEIVAGALQDHDRAIIVGETSFGKGLVQSVYQLSEDTGMALTTAHFYTPSGRLIQRDYSGSIFDYYNRNDGTTSAKASRETKYTDGGRKVLGGGGITPDYSVKMRELNRFEALLESKQIFFEYARRLSSEQATGTSDFKLPMPTAPDNGSDSKHTPRPHAEGTAAWEVTDPVLEDFQAYLGTRSVEYSEGDITSNSEFIRRRIKQEVYTSAFGMQEGFKVAIEGDNQMQKALEVLPEARRLLSGELPDPQQHANRR